MAADTNSVTITLTEGEAVELVNLLNDVIIAEKEHLDRFKAEGGRASCWDIEMRMRASAIHHAQATIHKIVAARGPLMGGGPRPLPPMRRGPWTRP